MNAFLLKVAIDEMIELSEEKGDLEYNKKLKELSKNLYDNIQEHAWKEVFLQEPCLTDMKMENLHIWVQKEIIYLPTLI